MARYALAYGQVILCSLLIVPPTAMSQEIDGQAVTASHHQNLSSGVRFDRPGALPSDVLYYATPLGDLPGGLGYSSAHAISEVGQVAGDSAIQGNTHEAFLWDPVDGMIGLGDLPGGSFQSEGWAINNGGHVAGSSVVDSFEAFLWTPEEGMIGLGDLPGGCYCSEARGMNDLDQVVGYSYSGFTDGYVEAFLWDPEFGMIGLGDLPGGQSTSKARDINNSCQVVGWSVSEAHAWGEAFIWDPVNGMRTLPDMPDGTYAYAACAINELGQISGQTNTGEAMLWDPQDGIITLGFLQPDDFSTVGHDLNDLGQVVGWATHLEGPWRALIWDVDHGMRKLSDLLAAGTDPNHTSLPRAKGINNAGQIIVSVYDFDEGLLLTPFVLGDLNCDELVDQDDIGPLLLLLLHAEEYAQTYPDCPGEWAADVNQDGVLDIADLHALRRFLRRPVTARPPRDVHLEPLPPGP